LILSKSFAFFQLSYEIKDKNNFNLKNMRVERFFSQPMDSKKSSIHKKNYKQLQNKILLETMNMFLKVSVHFG